ncbi:MAG: pantetheine-phosphate adenylyltransferase [Kangiellaceae bacterium]|nr:pantetheine-phosphate adenylyltransferase [Kangiellaceae bacterium]MCW9000764.1 pantetheine-phosphate adenylyltransferase [Kangiellaceae bacterium]
MQLISRENIINNNNLERKTPRAVYAFSADPITNGHINVVERISRSFQEVVVGIGRNPLKTYLFNLEERLQLARQALSHLANVKVLAFTGMVVDFASEQGANIIVKGVRNAADFDYEQTHHLVGVSQQAGIDTHILFADPALSHISSSAVKAIQIEHGTLDNYVPLGVKFALEAKISKQLIIGVTGEIATGKSTLCEQLEQIAKNRGIPLHNIDMDKMAHSLLSDKTSPMHNQTRQKIIQRFGEDICVDNDNGETECARQVDRKKLAAKVFGDLKALQDLNSIFIPPMTVLLRKSLYGKQGIIILNGALLAEASLLSACNNHLVLTKTSELNQKKRLIARNYSDKEIANRRSAQWSFFNKKQSIESAINQKHYGQLWSIMDPGYFH